MISVYRKVSVKRSSISRSKIQIQGKRPITAKFGTYKFRLTQDRLRAKWVLASRPKQIVRGHKHWESCKEWVNAVERLHHCCQLEPLSASCHSFDPGCYVVHFCNRFLRRRAFVFKRSLILKIFLKKKCIWLKGHQALDDFFNWKLSFILQFLILFRNSKIWQMLIYFCINCFSTKFRNW